MDRRRLRAMRDSLKTRLMAVANNRLMPKGIADDCGDAVLKLEQCKRVIDAYCENEGYWPRSVSDIDYDVLMEGL